MEKIMRIKEASRQVARSPKWLRMAEAAGTIPKAKRDMNNWRYDTEEDLKKIREIIFNQELRYPLKLFLKW
jgi:DNA-binding transcriptional MerR regulator